MRNAPAPKASYAKHERGLIDDRGQLDEQVEDEGERQHSDEHRPQSPSG